MAWAKVRAILPAMVVFLSLTMAGTAEASRWHTIEGVLANMPGAIVNGFVCGAGHALFVAPDETCTTPVGVGSIEKQWSNGQYMYAMVEDPNGNMLCIAGPVSEFSRHMKIAPLPGDAATAVELACMRRFGQVSPMPALALLVWY